MLFVYGNMFIHAKVISEWVPQKLAECLSQRKGNSGWEPLRKPSSHQCNLDFLNFVLCRFHVY